MSTVCEIDNGVSYTPLSSSSSIDFHKHFKWLNPFLLYLPMCTKQSFKEQQRRSPCLLWTCIILTVFFIMFRLGLKTWWNVQHENGIAYGTIYILYEVILTVSRLLTMYYFYSTFNYNLWISMMPQIKYDACCIEGVIKKYTKFIKLNLFIIFIIGSGTVFSREVQYTSAETTSQISKYLYDFFIIVVAPLCLLCIYWPLFISLAMACSIFLKYHCYLLYLINALSLNKEQQPDIDFSHMFNVYEQMQKKFAAEYNGFLKYGILIFLGDIILSLWLYSFEVLSANNGWQWDIIWVFGRCVILFLFVIMSSLITEAFEKFQRLLIEHGKDNLDKMSDTKWYNYLIVYTAKYPFEIKLGQVSVTKANTATFLIGFLIARIVSFSMYFLPYSNSSF